MNPWIIGGAVAAFALLASRERKGRSATGRTMEPMIPTLDTRARPRRGGMRPAGSRGSRGESAPPARDDDDRNKGAEAAEVAGRVVASVGEIIGGIFSSINK